MTDIWKEREKALENEYIFKQEQLKIERMRAEAEKAKVEKYCHNHCPKCGEALQAQTFRGVPLDQCPSCRGIWLGPQDLSILAGKDHRTWFDFWFKGEKKEDLP